MRLVLILSVLVIGASAQAQDIPAPQNIDAGEFTGSPSDISMSTDPEIWLYLHEQRRNDDPKILVRRKAEQQAAERMARIAAMKWYGYSNSRPRAEVTPFMSYYSPAWDGNGRREGRWYTSDGNVNIYYSLGR